MNNYFNASKPVLSPRRHGGTEKRQSVKGMARISPCFRVSVASWFLGLILCLSAAALAQHSDIPSSYRDLRFPAMKDIPVPEPLRFTLPNGMVIYLLEDRELPMVSASAMIRTGWRWEPVDKAGLAEMTGKVMRTGGTAQRPGDKLDEELDRLGAVVETGIGRTSGHATVSVLKEDAGTGLAILADLLRNPAFPEDKIELAKIELRNAICRRNDNANAIAFRETRRILYGPSSAYGHQPEYPTVDAISRQDLVAFHRTYFQPENILLAVWGDFESRAMRTRLEKLFAGWPRGGHPRPAAPKADLSSLDHPGIYSLEKTDINQSWVLISRLGGRMDDPDYYALSLMDTILGGGFSSRLFNQVRTRAGLAYSVFSVWSAGWDYPGLFVAGANTHAKTTLTALSAVRREIRRMTEQEVTPTELTEAKDAVLNGFAFEFDSTGKILQRLIAYAYYDYPADYLEKYQENIRNVSRADILKAGQKYLHGDSFSVLILGNPEAYEQPLSSLGKVTPVDIRIPGASAGQTCP